MRITNDANTVLILIILEVTLWGNQDDANNDDDAVLILIILEVTLWDAASGAYVESVTS